MTMHLCKALADKRVYILPMDLHPDFVEQLFGVRLYLDCGRHRGVRPDGGIISFVQDKPMHKYPH